MLTSLICFAFISFLFFSTAVFSADNVTNPTEQVAPHNTSNTQLPEWFYRELTSIRKDVSVLDATGASKEQIQELKERIGKVEVRLEETQLRVDDKLNEQSGRIVDIADANSFSINLFSVIAGVLGVIVAAIAFLFSRSAKKDAIDVAKKEAKSVTGKWVKETEKSIANKFDLQIATLSSKFNEELKSVKENAELQSIK